jgi:hypothetical protein
MSAEARFTVLKAFIRRGSEWVGLGVARCLSNKSNWVLLTWIADHAVLRPNRANDFFAIIFSLTPCKFVGLSDF